MTSPRILLNTWDLHAKKQMGQNFLNDPAIPLKIIEGAHLKKDDIVLEIGPGLGALTIPLAKTVRAVWAVEKDHQLIPLLQTELTRANISNTTLITGDILKLDIKDIFEKTGRKLTVLGNLPYNISSQVLVQLVQNRHMIDKAVLMFQKELAERIAAPPGNKTYGRISAMLQYCAITQSLFQIEARSFFPRPKIDSEVLKIDFLDTVKNLAEDEALLFRVVRVAFGKRRKTLKNALTGNELNLTAQQAENLLTTCGISPERRAETLHSSEFVALSNALLEKWKIAETIKFD